MTMPKRPAPWRTAAAVHLAVFLLTGAARGQDASELTRADERIERGLASKRGVVVFDLNIDKYRCEETSMTARRLDGVGSISLRGPGNGPLSERRPGAMDIMTPGTYEVTAVNCKVFKNINRQVLPFARFRVGAGEVVNIGRLKVTYKPDPGGNIFFGVNSGEVTKSVEPLDAAALAGLRQLAPKAMAKAVTRTMTMIGPTTSRVKKR